MLTLLNDCRFWTTNNDIQIEDNDFGVFRYYTKKDFANIQNIELEAKKEYHEERDGILIVNNQKPTRLKDNLRKLEELLKLHRVIKAEWKDACVIQILLSNGILIHICVNMLTGDILKMAFDKYFVGKLATDSITDALFLRQHIFLAYNTNQLTVVNLQKPNTRRNGPEKITNMEPKIFHVLIPGSTERKLERKLVVNSSFDLIIVWTKSSQNVIFPWRPTVEDQNHANMHVFKFRSDKLESIGYCWTENDPICAHFLRTSEGQILTVEQKVSRKGDMTAEICFYSIGKGKLQRISNKPIAIEAQICCCSLSPDQEKLLLCTIDRFICIYNLARKTTKFASKTDIIPTKCSWNPDSSIIMIANDRSQFQCFDFSLNLLANQITGREYKATNILDLSSYFVVQPNLLNITFSLKPDLNNLSGKYSQTDCFLMLLYENGPIGCLRFLAANGVSGDVYNSGLTPDNLCFKYLALNQLEKSVNILLSTNWENNGSMCLLSLHKITNYVLTQNEINIENHKLLVRALQTFSDTLNEETRNEYCDSIIDLKRKFFFYLLKNKLYLEGFEVARDVEDYDLFMDLYNCTKSDTKLLNFSHECYHQAELILNQDCKENNEDDDDTISSSSQSSSSYYISPTQYKSKSNVNYSSLQQMPSTSSQYLTVKRFQKPRLKESESFRYKANNATKKADVSNLKNYVPPLPYLKSPILNAKNVKINSPIDDNREFNNSNVSSVGKLQQFKTKLKSQLQDLTGDNEISAIYSSSTHRFTSQFRPVVPQLNTNSQEESSPLNSRDNYQLGIISTSFNESEDELPTNWKNIPDQTLGIPEITNQPYIFKSLTHPLLPRASTASINTRNNVQPIIKTNLGLSLQPQSETPSVPPKISLAQNSENIYSPKYFHQSLGLGNIPSSSLSQPTNISCIDTIYKHRKPTASILSNNSSNGSSIGGINDLTLNGNSAVLSKKDFGEKNKVKFSDTVQIAVVPEIPRKEKPIPQKRNGYLDPKKELADSLPLCHPHDEYLKDFNPLPVSDAQTINLLNNNNNNNNDGPRTEKNTSNNININNNIDLSNNNNNSSSRSNSNNDNKNASTIKVVHFGVV